MECLGSFSRKVIKVSEVSDAKRPYFGNDTCEEESVFQICFKVLGIRVQYQPGICVIGN